MLLKPAEFIFSDPAGKRWPRLRLALVIAGVIVFVGLVLFVQTLFVAPQLSLPFSLRQLKGQLKALERANPAAKAAATAPLWEKFAQTRLAARKSRGASVSPPRKILPEDEVRLAFYINGDPYSYASFEGNSAQITHVCPEWMAVINGLGDLQLDPDNRLPKLAASRGVALLPLLTNLVGDSWQPEAIENLAHGPPERQQRFIGNVLEALDEAHAAGVVVNWQQIDPTYKADIARLLATLADALHAQDKELWLCVQPGNELDYIDFATLSQKVDRFVALLYDETSAGEPPGPLASRSWFEGWLRALLEDTDARQWVIALGSYGYDWTRGAKEAELISFPEAMSRASSANVGSLTVAEPEAPPVFYYEDASQEHAVWFLDVVTFSNQLRKAREAHAGGIALYRLGAEDSAIWQALDLPRNLEIEPALKPRLEVLKGTDTITDVGVGEIVWVDDTRSDGKRFLTLNAEGYLTAEYAQFPQFPTLYHQGAGAEQQVAITFDDGPHPEWTPQILDILKAAQVKAAFFLTGVKAERYPGLVRRIVAEGHEIGNHTYYHPNLALCWPEHIRLELNATQLLIASITGRSTTLFRPPFAADTSPARMDELTALKIAQELGYLVVLENIDPQDWANPGADNIVYRVKQQRRDGSIILLHDAGGDRAQTVEALPQILEHLQRRGDTVVSLSTLLGTSRDALMPPLPSGGRSLSHYVSSTGFRIYHGIEQFLWAFMIVATALVVIRTLVVIWLASRFRRTLDRYFAEPLSVVVAAYNEEKVIAGMLRDLLAADYAGPFEVIVVDDGSTDRTSAEVEGFVTGDGRVRQLRQRNRGKAQALRRALGVAQHEIVVFLDADTHCQPDTLRRLVQPLAQRDVVAVSGHVKVGNLRTFIARCQALEYTCGFNLDRRAYTRWNCLTVVPGALSALRKKAIDQAGGLSVETLAEDTDLTLTLHKQRRKIVYVPEAIAWTEAPETVLPLARQRFRWAYGTLQCLWNIARWFSIGSTERSAGLVCRVFGSFRSCSSP